MTRILLAVIFLTSCSLFSIAQGTMNQVVDTMLFDTYTVQKGDNLYRIAINNSVTLDQLLDANKIKAGETSIYVGQEILIPKFDPTSDTAFSSEQQNLGYYQWKKKQLEKEMLAKKEITDSLSSQAENLKSSLSMESTSADTITNDQESLTESPKAEAENGTVLKQLAEIDSLKRLLEIEIAEKEKLKQQLLEEQEFTKVNSSPSDTQSTLLLAAESSQVDTSIDFSAYEAIESPNSGNLPASIDTSNKVDHKPIKEELAIENETDSLSNAIDAAQARVFNLEADIQSVKDQQQQLQKQAEAEAETPVEEDDINAILARMETAKKRAHEEKELQNELESLQNELLLAKETWNNLLREKELQAAGLVKSADNDVTPPKRDDLVKMDSAMASEEHMTIEEDGLITELFLAGTSKETVKPEKEKGKSKKAKIENVPISEIDFESTVFPVEEVKIEDDKKEIGVVDSTSRIKAEFFLARALSEIDQGNYKAAEKYVDKSLKLNPQYIEAQMLHGDIYSAFGYYENAQKDYLKVIQTDSLVPQAYYNLAQCLAFQGKDEKAFENYSKAISIDRNYVLAYSGRAAMYLKFQNYESAISDYTLIIDKNQYFLPAYRGRGFARYHTREYKAAIKDLNFYLEMENMDSYALYFRGMSQILNNNLYNGCLDLLKSSDLGYDQAQKAINKYCD